MKLNYELTNEDFLVYQLYASSKSKTHNQRRFRSRIIYPILYLLLGLYLSYINNNTLFLVLFVVFAILWFVFYPFYSGWYYKRHFKNHVNENYKNRVGKPVQIDFDETSFNAKDFASESRIRYSEIKELIETKHHFLIKLKTDLSLIIPKRAIEDRNKLILEFESCGVNYYDDTSWNWK